MLLEISLIAEKQHQGHSYDILCVARDVTSCTQCYVMLAVMDLMYANEELM